MRPVFEVFCRAWEIEATTPVNIELTSFPFLQVRTGRPRWPDFARLVQGHNGVWGGC
jgi:hypothetical protein